MQALKAVAVHREALKADSLQQLHTMHNLKSLVDLAEGLPQGVVPTLRDATLQKDADAIREARSSQAFQYCRRNAMSRVQPKLSPPFV